MRIVDVLRLLIMGFVPSHDFFDLAPGTGNELKALVGIEDQRSRFNPSHLPRKIRNTMA